MKYLYPFYRQVIILLFIFISTISVYGQKSRVQGRIYDDRKQPLAGALVIDKETQEVLGASDDDGNYSALVEKNQILVFESVGCKSQEVNVKGRQIINVNLEVEAVKLPGVEIVTKITNKVIPEPTEIEIKGNYFHLRTRVRVPQEMAKSNTRLIFQPFIADVTARTRSTLKPLVLDGREYTITQERMLNYDIEKDPLIPYLFTEEITEETNLLPYHDSIYVQDQHHDFRGEVLIAMENYARAFYRDSFVIAKGVVNPLRFFQYQIDASHLSDSSFIPKPALQLCNDKGEVQLVFRPSKAGIDMSIEKNVEEITKMKTRLSNIEIDPNSTLQSFEVFGTASPDGDYDRNVVLAKDRMKHASEAILAQLSPSTKQFIKVSSDAKVATWSDVVQLMRADSLPEAEKLQEIIDKYPKDVNYQGRAIKRLPFYDAVVSAQYLTRLRKVEYQFEYSLFRSLTDGEIKNAYTANPKQLTRYEYYRMFEITKDTAQLRKLYVQSLELYPKFLLAAHRLSSLDLSQGRVSEATLEPFLDKNAPQELLVNQVLTYLQLRLYNKANDLSARIPYSTETAELHSIVGIFNGNYESAYAEISAKGGLNEVLLLLAMKRNEEAFEKAEQLSPGIAIHEYVKAIAANRMDKVGNAIMYLENAFLLDPHLQEVATVDGDVNDLL